ncbi:succinate dehydrogenase, cytochrome b556 subunit [Epibacterium sp. MM17-32]|jgi:succinate dehydrogenase / fumarate reductase cytochrome b subunit|uniref:succinate dehydrogenase, cytochrome b556 subunit n=1 Tax=Epibacterium sp. MM17-32 TaxID=2917734 RepID=UPI001EF73E42|nr:succinate dehydrogenase, cytochrome b556 subunit [Epibacterium sp. MM17-32]MCG7627000.1 succinate dehydrogenase, cytochrome b556 subunit [Epibacterium sp. MM17-32]
MADVNRGNRPLSPFMIGPYYRPQLTSISSIMVRITGIASLGAALLVVWWLLAAATSASSFAVIDGLLRSFVGDIVLLLASWAIFYHMLGRLRHVIWDFGYCLEVATSEKMARGMFVGATVLAILAAIVL